MLACHEWHKYQADEAPLFLIAIFSVRFDEIGKIAWNAANKILEKVLNSLNLKKEIADTASATCLLLVSCIPGTAAPCTVPTSLLKTVLTVLRYVLIVVVAISTILYGTLVEGQNDRFERQRQEYTLANVNILHDNLISNFKLGQQLKLLLGGVLEAMPSNDGEEDETRRRLAVDCEDAINGECTDPTKVSCEDPKYLCDGFSTNWNYVAFLKFGERIQLSALSVFRNVQACLFLFIMNSSLPCKPGVIRKIRMGLMGRSQIFARIVTHPRFLSVIRGTLEVMTMTPQNLCTERRCSKANSQCKISWDINLVSMTIVSHRIILS
jgi:hypothetical protein